MMFMARKTTNKQTFAYGFRSKPKQDKLGSNPIGSTPTRWMDDEETKWSWWWRDICHTNTNQNVSCSVFITWPGWSGKESLPFETEQLPATGEPTFTERLNGWKILDRYIMICWRKQINMFQILELANCQFTQSIITNNFWKLWDSFRLLGDGWSLGFQNKPSRNITTQTILNARSLQIRTRCLLRCLVQDRLCRRLVASGTKNMIT